MKNDLPWYFPNSAMNEEIMKKLPAEVAMRTPSALFNLASGIYPHNSFGEVLNIETIVKNINSIEISKKLSNLFNHYGSDKSSTHNYHLLYGSIFNYLDGCSSLLEIGLGSNNLSIASNMGDNGKPGASLCAFKDFLPNSNICGADIDREIKVKDCEVFYIDQTKPESFEAIENNSRNKYDLIIDDGLHSPDANLFTLDFALRNISPKGFIVIEDIPSRCLPIWMTVQYLLINLPYHGQLFQTKSAFVFVCSKNYFILN